MYTFPKLLVFIYFYKQTKITSFWYLRLDFIILQAILADFQLTKLTLNYSIMNRYVKHF